jgi:hypothetical protein
MRELTASEAKIVSGGYTGSYINDFYHLGGEQSGNYYCGEIEETVVTALPWRDYDVYIDDWKIKDPFNHVGGDGFYSGDLQIEIFDQRDHRYKTDTVVEGFSVDKVYKMLLQHAAPGQEGSSFTGKIVSVPVLGQIVQTVNPFNHSVTNTTMPGHMLHPGNVVRSVVMDEDGRVHIRTVGTGTGSGATVNEWASWPLWKSLDQVIIFDLQKEKNYQDSIGAILMSNPGNYEIQGDYWL